MVEPDVDIAGIDKTERPKLAEEGSIPRGSGRVVKLPSFPLALQRLDHRPDRCDSNSTSDQDAARRRWRQWEVVPWPGDLDPLSDTQAVVDVAGRAPTGTGLFHADHIPVSICRPVAKGVGPTSSVG